MSTEHCIEPRKTAEWSRLIDQVVTDELSGADWETLRGHLKACERCRGQYNHAARAARMLAGGPDAAFRPSPGELDRIAVAAMPPEKTIWSRALAWFGSPAGAGLTLAVGAAVALIVILPSLNKPKPEFQSRGGKDVDLFSSTGAHPLPSRQAGLRAFCVAGSSLTALEPGDARCPRAAQLKLTTSNRGKFARLFVVGVDDKRDVKWYAPRPPETASIPAPATGEDSPVAAVRLGVNHEAGPVRVYALFSDAPVNAADVEAAVAKIPAGPLPESLPLVQKDVLQRGLSFVVE